MPVDSDTSVKVAVRIRPLNDDEIHNESHICIDAIQGSNQIVAGSDNTFTFDNVFGIKTDQDYIYRKCVADLVDATFEGFNATILAYGQTGSGKTFTMGSSSDLQIDPQHIGIIPRVVKNVFQRVRKMEEDDPNSRFKILVQFIEIYGEEIRDLLDITSSSKVQIRESHDGCVFVSGAKEELISSYEQMMKALEDGTKCRATAATKMNQTSSRSHAIFTLLLEQIIHTPNPVSIDGADENEFCESGIASPAQEVRKSKFHFVDLAGSERAKRTGAQGMQLKEGIDINKGLLALGNVISALGDESKRGKVFVPYRDSKLTRMLQDSLGGNSKTLMICCVSPSSLNFSESVNALRYANRARNIQNKPVVNRDPTLVYIDELKQLLRAMAVELVDKREHQGNDEPEHGVPNDVLRSWANVPDMGAPGTPKRKASGYFGSGVGFGISPFAQQSNRNLKALDDASDKINSLKSNLRDSDYEIHRLTEQLKRSRQQVSETQEQLIMAQSEKEFFKMKWTESNPDEAKLLENDENNESVEYTDEELLKKANVQNEKTEVMTMIAGYLREIQGLKNQLADEQVRSQNAVDEAIANLGNNPLADSGILKMDEEFNSNVAKLLDETKEQLLHETELLKDFEGIVEVEDVETSDKKKPPTDPENPTEIEKNETETVPSSETNKTENDPENETKFENETEIEEEVSLKSMEEAAKDLEEQHLYSRRTSFLSHEVEEIGKSIKLKEQLMLQLSKSQQQYTMMKSYYEQKLQTLSSEMQEKELEREHLLKELSEVSGQQNEQLQQKQAREKRLKEALQKKDDELKKLKERHGEINKLSQAPSRYSTQVNKLENEISMMKKHRVNLSKTLQTEKKNYMSALSAKAKEIERLKKSLFKSNNETKKLERDKEMALNKAKGAMHESAMLRKQKIELQRNVTTASNARAAIKAMSKVSRMNVSGTKRILTEEELRTKKWLDRRVAEISAREAAAEALRREYETQLELLNRQASLEKQKDDALGFKDENSLSIVSSNLLTVTQAETLLEIENQISAVQEELETRNKQINDIQHKIVCEGEVAGPEKTMEVLKRTAAGSLRDAHDLIRLLFDMLVQSSRSMQLRTDLIREITEREKILKNKLEEEEIRLLTQKRTHDRELSQAASEYEERLHGIFRSIFPDEERSRLLLSHMNNTNPNTNKKEKENNLVDSNFNMDDLQQAATNEENEKSTAPNTDSPSGSTNPLRVQLSISLEEVKFLRSQLERETMKLDELHGLLSQVESEKSSLIRQLSEKMDQISFLEEDRSLFKELADDLKSGLVTLGKPGKNVLDSVRDRTQSRKKSNGLLFTEYAYMSDDDEDDSESILGEFDFLADEIARTGEVGFANPLPPPPPPVETSKTAVYERLTHPSNFTGRMKNVFEKDLEVKRRKIKEIRNQDSKKKDNNTSNTTLNTRERNNSTSSNPSNNPSDLTIDPNAPVATTNENINYPQSGSSYNSEPMGFLSSGPKSARGRIERGNREPSPMGNNTSTSVSHSVSSNTFGYHKPVVLSARPLPSSSSRDDASVGSENNDNNSVEGFNTKKQGSSPLPKVFTRLSTKFTGVHKHRNVSDPGAEDISPRNSNGSTGEQFFPSPSNEA